MDYIAWAQEYLLEAEKLKEKVNCLKKELKIYRGDNTRELSRRITMLYSMYLECKHTAAYLRMRGESAGECVA